VQVRKDHALGLFRIVVVSDRLGRHLTADIQLEELVRLNHDINPDKLEEGQTLLVPADKLSARDKEILAGIGPRSYRTYPVRKGETLADIITKRKITREEMIKLNPDVNLDKLAGEQHARDLLREQQRLRMWARLNKSWVRLFLCLLCAANQILKLPANKYTTREKEMLLNVVPVDFFSTEALLNKGTIFSKYLASGGAFFCPAVMYMEVYGQ
jgi:LysM domain